MPDPQGAVAICCYIYRAVADDRCWACKASYGCPRFRSAAELLRFNDMIPPSMVAAPLPLGVWPNMLSKIGVDPAPSAVGDASAAEDSPLRRLAAVLGLVMNSDSSSA